MNSTGKIARGKENLTILLYLDIACLKIKGAVSH